MSLLASVLILKISGTLLFVAPLILAPGARLLQLGGLPAEAVQAVSIYRLLGVAYLALLVGYSSGFPAIEQGTFPWAVVVMGIVSNGGAAIALVTTGVWRQALPRVGLAFTALIAALLAVAAALGDRAIVPLF